MTRLRSARGSARRSAVSFALAGALAMAIHGCELGDDEDESGRPCKSSDDCDNGYCIPLEGEPLGGRSVCTRECADTSECIPGWKCAPVPNAANLCKCQPSDERCDGLDNDCNGVIDDAPKAEISCANTIGPGPWTCSRGECTCGAPNNACPFGPTQACVDLQNDRFNCGACLNRCGGQCSEGKCVCPERQFNCNGTCVDLTSDELNCGACGVICKATNCVAGSCGCPGPAHDSCIIDAEHACGPDGRCRQHTNPAGAVAGFVGALAVANAHLYYAVRLGEGAFVDRRIERVAKSGGTPEVVVQLAAQYLPSLASNGADLFYGTRKIDPTEDVIVRCPGGVCGTSAIELASGTSATAMTIAGAHVYWLDGLTGEAKRCELSGCDGTPTVLAAPPTGATAAANGAWEGWIAADLSQVVVGYLGGGVIATAPGTGGTAQVLATASSLSGLAMSGTTVWYLDSTAVWSVPKSGDFAATQFAAVPSTFSLAVTDANVYWGRPTYFVEKCPTTGCLGGTPFQLTSRGANVRAIAVDATHVYYGGYTLGRIEN